MDQAQLDSYLYWTSFGDTGCYIDLPRWAAFLHDLNIQEQEYKPGSAERDKVYQRFGDLAHPTDTSLLGEVVDRLHKSNILILSLIHI